MTGAKPLYRFRDRALAGLMAARGWFSAVRALNSEAGQASINDL